MGSICRPTGEPPDAPQWPNLMLSSNRNFRRIVLHSIWHKRRHTTAAKISNCGRQSRRWGTPNHRPLARVSIGIPNGAYPPPRDSPECTAFPLTRISITAAPSWPISALSFPRHAKPGSSRCKSSCATVEQDPSSRKPNWAIAPSTVRTTGLSCRLVWAG